LCCKELSNIEKNNQKISTICKITFFKEKNGAKLLVGLESPSRPRQVRYRRFLGGDFYTSRWEGN
jgi:hypothetical protein